MSEQVEIKKYYRFRVRMVDGETEAWNDIDYNKAQEYLDKIKAGKNLVFEDYFLNAKNVVVARIDEYKPYVPRGVSVDYD